MPPHQGGSIFSFVREEQIKYLHVLTASNDRPRPVKRLTILDEPPQPVDPFQGFDKERISAAFDNGLMHF
jgi:hypothetical protein